MKHVYDYVNKKILREVGFKSYREYLASDLWAKIREECLNMYPNCQCCGNKAEHVHHRIYSAPILSGKQLKLGTKKQKIFSLCANCHSAVHFKEDGSKRNYQSQHEELKNRLHFTVEK